jgi:hypothetical protein
MAGAAGEFDRDAGGDGGRSGGSGAARGPKISRFFKSCSRDHLRFFIFWKEVEDEAVEEDEWEGIEE